MCPFKGGSPVIKSMAIWDQGHHRIGSGFRRSAGGWCDDFPHNKIPGRLTRNEDGQDKIALASTPACTDVLNILAARGSWQCNDPFDHSTGNSTGLAHSTRLPPLASQTQLHILLPSENLAGSWTTRVIGPVEDAFEPFCELVEVERVQMCVRAGHLRTG